MKIVLIIPTMDLGGAEKQLALLAIGLKQRGEDVHVVLLTREGPRSDALRAEGVAVTVIGKRFQGDPMALIRLTGLFKRLRPDVVHTWLFAANSFGRVAARLAGVKTILASERCVDPWKATWQLVLDRFLIRWTDAITTNSSGVREFYVSAGLPAEKFELIPNGVRISDQVAKIDRTTALSRLEVSPERKLILTVGRLWPQKRMRNLIWAGELIGELRDDTTLVIIGDGPQRGELLRHRDAVTRPERVRFAGWRDDVAQLMPHADAYWIGSEYEGQSNSVIEAMSSGVPVVASDIPGNRDLVVHGETGWLFPVGDEAALARLTQSVLLDRQMTVKIVENAKNRMIGHFGVDQMVESHLRLYRRLNSA